MRLGFMYYLRLFFLLDLFERKFDIIDKAILENKLEKSQIQYEPFVYQKTLLRELARNNLPMLLALFYSFIVKKPRYTFGMPTFFASTE